MYHQYFGLKEAPFSIAVNPRYLFMSARHREALAHLLYGVGDGGGFILLTGEVGTGKTTINRCLLDQLPENIDLALVLNPAVSAAELLATVCDELGIAYNEGEKSLKLLTDKIHQFLMSNHAAKRRTVLLIDEAQHLRFDVLEQIRLLTNLETNTEKLLQIILVGQPELQQLLAKPELRQLSQRITARYQLKPLNLEETESYIRHRLQVAGFPAGQELFPARVVKSIYTASNGIPRLINVICDRILLGAYGQNKNKIDDNLFKQAAVEVFGDESELSTPVTSYWLPVAGGCLMVLLLSIAWWQWFYAPEPAHTDVMLPASVDQTAQPLASPPLNPVTPSPTLTVTAPLWYKDQTPALNELLLLLGFLNSAVIQPCVDRGIAYRCESLEAQTWLELQAYNRPAVLELVTNSKLLAFAVLLGIDGEQAIVSYNNNVSKISLEQLGSMWTGRFVFAWQPSEYYSKPFAFGDRGPVVAWLATQFAAIDQQQILLSGEKFNAALAERVKIFQRENDLADDGVVGLKTLLKINEALQLERTLDDFAALTQALAGEG